MPISVISFLQCHLNFDACDEPLSGGMVLTVQGGLYASCGVQAWVKTTPEDIMFNRNFEGTCAKFDGNRLTPIEVLLYDWINLGLENGICSKGGFRSRIGPKAPAASQNLTALKGTTNVAAATPQLYDGVALTISGAFHMTSKHDNKLKETGMLEFTPFFGYELDANTINRGHVVQPKAAKLRFTREKVGNYEKEGEGLRT